MEEFLDERKLTSVQFLILAICYFCMMLDGFDIVIISFTAAAISRDLTVSAGQLGIVFSAGLVGMTLGAMFLSSIADIHGRRFLIGGALIAAGLATLSVAYVDSVGALILLRFVAGLGLGVVMAVLPAAAGEFSPSAHRNFILSIMVSGASVGAIVGGIFSAEMMASLSWRGIYLYTGFVNVAAGVLFSLLVPETIHHLAKRSAADTLERVNRVLRYLGQPRLDTAPVVPRHATESASVRSLLAPGRRKTTLLAWGGFFMGFAAIYFLTSWLPKLLVDVGISEELSIRAVIILNVGAILGAALIGWMSRRWKINNLIAIFFAAATVLILLLASAILLPGGPMISLVWGLSFLIGIALNGAFANLYTLALLIYPISVRITGVGWCYGLGRTGAIFSPALAGVLLGLNVSSYIVLCLFAAAVVLAAAMVWRIELREMV
ncbi:MAG: MFS transporter [Porticoccaceae bacterium]